MMGVSGDDPILCKSHNSPLGRVGDPGTSPYVNTASVQFKVYLSNVQNVYTVQYTQRGNKIHNAATFWVRESAHHWNLLDPRQFQTR